MPVERLLLAPGASGTIAGLAPHRDGLRRRGLDVGLVELPKGRAERAVPVYAAALSGEDPSRTLIGGHSFGGRVASLVAVDARPAGVVLLSYPLHAPGRREAWDERTAHWPRIACPVLVLSGTSDPFAEIGLLRGAVERLERPTLVEYPGVGHGLRGVLDDVLDRIAAWASAIT